MDALSISLNYNDPLWITIALLLGLAAKQLNLPPLVGFLVAGFLLNLGGAQGGAFLSEFTAAGFREAVILRTTRNARTSDPRVIAAEVRAGR